MHWEFRRTYMRRQTVIMFLLVGIFLLLLFSLPIRFGESPYETSRQDCIKVIGKQIELGKATVKDLDICDFAKYDRENN